VDLGLHQLKFIDTDWAYYRGKLNQDGSSFLQYSRPPPLPTGGCRDTLKVGGIFVDNNPGLDKTVVAAGASFPATMSAAFSDPPGRGFDLSRTNALTGKDNFLREAQTELHFCTVLSLQSAAGAFQHLKSVYWNVHCRADSNRPISGTSRPHGLSQLSEVLEHGERQSDYRRTANR